jgi:hypothetical protein
MTHELEILKDLEGSGAFILMKVSYRNLFTGAEESQEGPVKMGLGLEEP